MRVIMANTTSAKKAERAAQRRAVFNLRRKKAMKDAFKATQKLIAGKKGKEAAASLPKLYQAIDKAAKSNVITKNAAARIKSRVSKRLAAVTK